MDSIEVSAIARRTRIRYEWARLKRALLGLAPLLLVVAVAAAVARRPALTGAFGLAAFVSGAALLWYGRDPQRAVLPGVLSGLVPLMLALCANRLHFCSGGACISWCMPACSLGGLVAGFLVARSGNRRRAGPSFWLASSALALLTGAMGCACVGYSGLAGLALGFAVGVTPGLLRRAH
jgi:hypothetical protein